MVVVVVVVVVVDVVAHFKRSEKAPLLPRAIMATPPAVRSEAIPIAQRIRTAIIIGGIL